MVGGGLVTPSEAKQRYLEAAAANWHALARFALRYTEGQPALMIDIGSTTCDVIPLAGNRVTAIGTTDTERFLQSELIYMGVERTPVATMVRSLPFRGRQCPIARELFATALDVYVTLGDIAEDEANCDTADGRPSVRPCARTRLARCICTDDEQFTDADAVVAARVVASLQADELATAIQRVGLRIGEPSPIRFPGRTGFLSHLSC